MTAEAAPVPISSVQRPDAAALKENWGWMALFGSLLVVAGLVALGSVLTATIASVLVVGAAMIVSGVAEIIHGLAMRRWKKFLYWVTLGILYLVAGVVVFEQPLIAASVFTLALGAFLFATGLVRMILAFNLPKSAPWVLVGISALITFILGVLILAQWPLSSLWVIGLFLGIDLIFAGAAWIAFSLALRRGDVPLRPQVASGPIAR